MKSKIAVDPRARWRHRFLEIARQVEGPDCLPPARPIAGMRIRARLAANRGARLLAPISSWSRGPALR